MQSVIWALRLIAAFWAYLALDSNDISLVARFVAYLLPAAILGGITLKLEKHRRRWLTAFRDRQARELLDRIVSGVSIDEPIFLYLRPFSSTGNLTIENPNTVATNPAMPGSYEPRELEAESVLRDALDRYGTLIALGRPGEHYGAGRIATEEEQWQATFDLLAERATLIFLLPSDAAGTSWEVERLHDLRYVDKTIIVMPPASENRGFSTTEEWAKAHAKFATSAIALPQHQAAGALFSARAEARRTALSNWMTQKERKLRKGLLRLASDSGVVLTPRPSAGRRTDAPVLPALSWMLVFSLMTWGLRGVPTFAEELERAARASWGLTAIAVALVLFLLLESTYGHIRGKAFALLAILAVFSTTPYEWLPSPAPFAYLAYRFPLVMLIQGAIYGVLLAAILREIVPGKVDFWRVPLLMMGSLLSATFLTDVVDRTLSAAMEVNVSPPMQVVAGLLFGFALPHVMKWDPWKPDERVRAPLGVDGVALAWLVAGHAISQLQWGGERQALLWVALGLGGGIAQWYGWSRQGRPLPWPRGLAMVLLWAIAGGVVMQSTRWLWSFREVSVMGASDWYLQSNALQAQREGLNGVLFGIIAVAIAVLIRKAARQVAVRQMIFLGIGFGLFGMLSTDYWSAGADDQYVASPPLIVLVAALMACAAYLEVRKPRAPVST